MKIGLFLLTSGACVIGATATPIGTLPTGTDGVVQLEMRHYRKGGRISKRTLDDVYGSYSIVFEIGTPPQRMQALLDTGSSDMWVNKPETGQTPSYNTQQSSSYKLNSSGFDIQYGAGAAKGDWVTDTVSIAGATIQDQTFGAVSDPTAGSSIMGIGMVENESSKEPYVNIPQNLKDHGHIKHNAYSIFLDNLEASTGRVLFGGVDESKYTGQLMTVPFTDPKAFYVSMSGLKIGNTEVIDSPIPGLLDSGTTFTYLPVDLSKKIADAYGAEYDDMTGLYFVKEKTTAQPDFEFDLSGAKITVPAKEMVVEASQIIDRSPPLPYVLGIVPSYDPPYILGDTFLRSTYAVYDLENRQLSLAQSSYSGTSSIKVIEGSVPGAAMAPMIAST